MHTSRIERYTQRREIGYGKKVLRFFSMDTTISDEEIQQILYNCWEDIPCFAYEGYNTNGRGVARSLHERSPSKKNREV